MYSCLTRLGCAPLSAPFFSGFFAAASRPPVGLPVRRQLRRHVAKGCMTIFSSLIWFSGKIRNDKFLTHSAPGRKDNSRAIGTTSSAEPGLLPAARAIPPVPDASAGTGPGDRLPAAAAGATREASPQANADPPYVQDLLRSGDRWMHSDCCASGSLHWVLGARGLVRLRFTAGF